MPHIRAGGATPGSPHFAASKPACESMVVAGWESGIRAPCFRNPSDDRYRTSSVRAMIRKDTVSDTWDRFVPANQRPTQVREDCGATANPVIAAVPFLRVGHFAKNLS